ncbi:MAG: hypothetical protein IPL84_18575 [Chitinophagaceae bacterium]|nr:hypothetical protein [Chitinophagaceae bacterium]
MLGEKTNYNAINDFYQIFMWQEENVVLELLSLYCKSLIDEGEKMFFRFKRDNEKDAVFQNEKRQFELQRFVDFAQDLNEVFTDFGLDIYLTQNGFIPKQDEKIVTEIFEPVIKCLADTKWKEVNNILTDAFVEYRKNTPKGYSSCVTHTVSAIQAFLQILVLGKTGTGDISKLITQAQKEGLVPSDMFTKEIFKTIESVMMRERQETGDAHPKKDYASERNAKMVLNLAMVFIQHCLVN